MICFAQGGYKSHTLHYHKGQTKETSDTFLEPPLLALEMGLSSDIFPGFVLPFTSQYGQNEKLPSLSFFSRALEDLPRIALTFSEQMSAKGAGNVWSFLTGWAGSEEEGL